MSSLETAMRALDKDCNLMEGDLLEDCDLLYPEEAICFRPIGKVISKDGATVKLAPFLSLSENRRTAKTPVSPAVEANDEAEKLLRNGRDPAFSGDAGNLIQLKDKGTGLIRYVYVAKGTSVGRLCFLIAMEYKILVESSRARNRFGSAVLFEVVLTHEMMGGLWVWEAHIRHDIAV